VADAVVKDQMEDDVDPLEFLATIFQWYVVPGLSVPG
jgi:hypothetical protein